MLEALRARKPGSGDQNQKTRALARLKRTPLALSRSPSLFSADTIRNRLAAIFAKLEVTRRSELVYQLSMLVGPSPPTRQRERARRGLVESPWVNVGPLLGDRDGA
jgi:hypothetical protein